MIKVAHFGNWAPNACGMYATTRDIVLAERMVGIDSRFIDWGHAKERKQQFSRVGLNDKGVKTTSPEWAIEKADILVLHSAIPPEVKKCGKPIVVAIHGRPEYSFVLEKMKKGSCLQLYHIHGKDPQVRGFYTFWKEHLDHWNLLIDGQVDYVPAMVDLAFFNPNGKKFNFRDKGGKPNIIIADVWREDVSPFNVLFAAAKFIKERCPEGRIHVFGVSGANETTAMANLMNPLKKQNIVGAVHGLLVDVDQVYRAGDILVTPHNIATRVVRESLASGCPIVAGTGSKYTEFQADPYDIPAFTVEIERCWNRVKEDPNLLKQKVRQIAEKQFNLENAGKAVKEIYERVMKEPKPKLSIKTMVKKPTYRIHNFIPYCPGWENKNIGKAYNACMKLIPENDWACFIDHDAMYTTPNWYNQLYVILEKNPDFDCLTAVTNRIGNPGQRFASVDKNNHDILYHRQIGAQAQALYFSEVKDVTNEHFISGVVMLVKKSAWKKVAGFKEDGFLGIDNDFHSRLKKAGCKVGVMKGIYVYHVYRADNKQLKPIGG